MLKRLAISLLLVALQFKGGFVPLYAQKAASPFDAFPSMRILYHPVSTKNLLAQQFFNKGLLYNYAFNHDASYYFFEKAAQNDPELAMAYWGMALSLGQNINRDITPENQKKAHELIQKALSLMNNATTNEQDYIRALSVRYQPTVDKIALRHQYKSAMEFVSKKYPEDLDAATLYAESILDLSPWEYWNAKGQPEEVIREALDVLESVLKRNPDHLGANHYYIHAIEESPSPERGLMAAHRLESLLPEGGHILHMPSHIYLLVGDYDKAAEANEKAVKADEEYIKKHGIEGFYPLHYLSHNLFFLTRAYMWQERFQEAFNASKRLEQFYVPHFREMPNLAYYALAPMQVLLYFHKWNSLLELPQPPEEMKGVVAFWHFARAMAYISLGDVESGFLEKQLFLKEQSQLDPESLLGFSRAQHVLKIAEYVLNARFERMEQRYDSSIKWLQKAAALQDQLFYNEPPDWFYPIRQPLGALLIKEGRFKEAEGEFREALVRLPRNGRSLFGLYHALKAQNQLTDAYWVKREARTALRNADAPLKLADL